MVQLLASRLQNNNHDNIYDLGTYCYVERATQDNDHRVREATHKAMGAFLAKVRKDFQDTEGDHLQLS